MAHIDDPQTQRANLSFIKASMKAPLLSRDHEFDLARRWQQNRDEKALHALVSSHTRLVIAVASRFRNYGLPLGDLVQEGNLGLMQAASRFEPEREVRFSTYAAWWIRSTIQEFVLRNWSIVRTGTTAGQKSLFFNLRRLRARIDNNPSATSLTLEGRRHVARELDVSEQEVETMEIRLTATDQSLNHPLSEEGGEWQDFLADDGPSPEQIVIGLKDSRSRTAWLSEAMDTLSPRERTIIAARRLREDGATLEELGHTLGVSKERVRQLEHRAMGKLRQSIMRHVGRPEELFVEA
ncbi:RNA polymerase factor sigma-32 [Nitrospirillum pindoramense]|uniref:RNA polymerase sigma factor n=1 Tax=Nitrospirillum amazonense TaxID=28077 RepID=A0A560H5U2_9PROT|nr:RNA polymerase factor sigma-32 [Nitrospirillum amazonense]TWB41663.1 RNA polymerase sigma-32 factor [Nitrospirillum amazonense]